MAACIVASKLQREKILNDNNTMNNNNNNSTKLVDLSESVTVECVNDTYSKEYYESLINSRNVLKRI